MNILISPFVNLIFGAYYLVGSLGWAVILITVLIRLALMPLLLPSLKSANKIRELQPKLKKLQEKYQKDKEGLAKAQMEMYKQEGVNPLSGCLPNLLQVGVLIIFFSAFNMVAGFAENKVGYKELNNQLISQFQISDSFKFDLNFLGSDITATPAKVFGQGIGLNLVLPLILLIGSGILQFVSAKLMMPPKSSENVTKATPEKSDDMMAAMQTQSTYFMPLMTVVIGWSFSLGILLYWFMNSLVMLLQQMIANKMNK
jgi:YidC/Oxa1 family membrane protein insertase